MALPNLPTSSASLSFSELKTHFGNAAYPPDNLSDYYGAVNTATWYDPDATLPSMVITASEVSDGDTSNHETISLTFTSGEATSDFAVGDIVVSNGYLSSFAATSSTVYTATFTVVATGATTIDVAAGTFHGTTSNAPNSVAAQFNWTTTYVPPDNGKILVLHRPATNYYRGDYQLNTITIAGGGTTNSFTFDEDAEDWEWYSWLTSGTATSVATAYAYDDSFYSSILTASTSSPPTRRWNRRTGSTPSSATGISNLGSYYIYTESSGGSAYVFVARSPEITLGSGTQTITIQAGSYGSSIGTVYYYWMPTGVTSGNLTDKVLMYTDAETSTTTIQNLSGTFTT